MKLTGRGITVKLYEQTETGRDRLNRPVITERLVEVENILVGQPTTEEVLDTLNLTGKKAVYMLGIPKGDEHVWEDRTVEFWGVKWKTIGFQLKGIKELIPMDWDSKIMVERYG